MEGESKDEPKVVMEEEGDCEKNVDVEGKSQGQPKVVVEGEGDYANEVHEEREKEGQDQGHDDFDLSNWNEYE